MVIARDKPFHFVGRVDDDDDDDDDGVMPIYLLASNISMWITDGNRSGLLLQLDHWNSKTNLKDTTLKYCDQNPEVEGANCTIVDYKNGTNHLNNGKQWTLFWIKLNENRTGVEMYAFGYEKGTSVLQWIWNNATSAGPITSQTDSAISVKSHQRNAALCNFNLYKPDFANNKEITKIYSKKKTGKLCVWVGWDENRPNDSIELMEVQNLASGRVEPATNTTQAGNDSTYFQWNHLDSGEYEITLRFDRRQPWHIDLCIDSNIAKTWMSFPKAITNCLFIGHDNNQFTAWPSSTPDPTLKPNWTMDGWEYVCDRLGISSNDAEVPIKFCNFYGCNFSKCPHAPAGQSKYLLC